MNCTRFRAGYCDYADGDLDEAAEIAMIRHLASCLECRRFQAALEAGCGVLRELEPVQASEDFDRRLRERLSLEPHRPAGAADGVRAFVTLAGVMVVVVAAGVVGWEVRSRESAGPPSPSRLAGVELKEPALARPAHDTSFGRDPFRVLPPPTWGRKVSVEHMELTVDWMVP
jgi:hypothetical protein